MIIPSDDIAMSVGRNFPLGHASVPNLLHASNPSVRHVWYADEMDTCIWVVHNGEFHIFNVYSVFGVD